MSPVGTVGNLQNNVLQSCVTINDLTVHVFACLEQEYKWLAGSLFTDHLCFLIGGNYCKGLSDMYFVCIL